MNRRMIVIGACLLICSVIQAQKIPSGAKALMKAYPTHIRSYANNQLVFADGTELTYDDGKKKSLEERMDNADPEDMFLMRYDTNRWKPTYLYDPGRIRCEALMKKLYGNTAQEVEKQLIKIDWFGQQVRFTSACGAADSLKAVARELAKDPELKQYLQKSSTYYWRKVRGANRLSAHSYGMTIDICVDYSNYWLWSNKGKSESDEIKYVNRIPHELVTIFERHGFIWGGRWYHYDTMHFEFRPELFY